MTRGKCASHLRATDSVLTGRSRISLVMSILLLHMTVAERDRKECSTSESPSSPCMRCRVYALLLSNTRHRRLFYSPNITGKHKLLKETSQNSQKRTNQKTRFTCCDILSVVCKRVSVSPPESVHVCPRSTSRPVFTKELTTLAVGGCKIILNHQKPYKLAP
jgi:hypothetical protein